MQLASFFGFIVCAKRREGCTCIVNLTIGRKAGTPMGRLLEEVAVAAGKKDDVLDLLERVLGPDDQAWVVCTFTECAHNVKGRCNIYTVHNVPRMKQGKPCDTYEKRV